MPISAIKNKNKSTKKTRPSSYIPKTIPLQDDAPSTPRKRNNSLIPLELMMSNNDEGGRERVALATVFGVPEYIDSKGLWDRQNEGRKSSNPTKPTPEHSKYTATSTPVAGRPLSFAFGDDINHQSKFISYVDSVLDHVGSNGLLDPSSLGPSSLSTPTPTPTKSFALPRIPTVSEFNDILTDPTLNTASGELPSPSMEEKSPLPEEIKEAVKEDIALPNSKLDLIVGSPDVFDLIVSDNDERFIIWGPDPLLVSSSMATATPERPSSYANLYNNQYKRPELKGFSSNITANTVTSKKSNRASLIAAGRQWSTSHKSEESGSIFLRKAFSTKRKAPKKKESESEQNTKAISQVIEAASVHKLVEKLTNTLDYTLMTDFFLTYRDFLSSEDLCSLLISRFYWALKNDEEARRIVRIRTFVVFRHWLNNYFVHDFIGNRPLRVILTNFLNELPRHPLVRQSPRDQRIVKILKRVLRRLKKLYYQQSSGASRVKVIPPPPPTAEQEQMGEIVRAKLSQSAIRRKTAIGLDMSSHYHGNMAVQDARYASVVVVGSLNKKSSFIDSGVESSPTQVSRFLTQQSTSTAGVDETSMHYRYDKNVHSETNNKAAEVSSVISVTSDDSLESEISAGDTIPNELDESDDDYPYGANNDSQTDDEHDREWLREQEETLEYFRLAKEKNLNISNEYTLPTNKPENEYSPPSTPSAPSTPIPLTFSMKEKESMPVLPNTIHRVPSERWCKSDELSRHPLDTEDTRILPDEILQELSETESKVPTGLSKRLSRKSIERRKSEKSLKEAASGSSSPHLTYTEIPQVPELPLVAPDEKLAKRRSLKKRKSKTKVTNPELVEKFASVPYESTQAPEVTKSSDNPNKQQPKLSKVLSKVFKHNQQPEESDNISLEEPTVDPVPQVQEPTTTEAPVTEKESEEPQGSQLVSLIARRLRYDSIDESIHPGDDPCDCPTCSGNKESTSSCRRLSVLIVPDNERRKSLELRRKRGASFIKQEAQGPVYLGNLHDTDHTSVVEQDKKSEVFVDDNTSENSEKATEVTRSIVPSSAKSNMTDFPANSVRERMSMISSFSEMPRSKAIELDLPSPVERLPVMISSGRCFIMSYKTSVLASQFCFVERDVLVKVGWEELIHCKWTKMDPSGNITGMNEKRDSLDQPGEHINYTRQLEKRRHQEQGIEQVIQRFNTVCQWVATEIVRTRNISERVKLIEKFIKLAKKCQLYSNYATLVQILLGLQSPAVARLERTWSKVSPKYQKILGKLTEFTSPMKNWKHIRDSMTEVAEEYGNSPAEVQVELPGTTSYSKFTKTTRIKIPFGGCIPFLGIYLSDLVFNFEKPRYLKPNLDSQKIYMAYNTQKLPPCLEQPLINFRKHRVIATVVKRVLTFQSLAMRYSFDEDLYLIEKCRNLQVLDAARIRELSNSLE